MNWSRPPAVAGLFYPEDRDELRDEVEGMLGAAPGGGDPRGDPEILPLTEARPPKAVIAPHAGYVYSGPIAASAYVRLGPFRDTVRRVILLGPAHRLGFRGLAASSAKAFETPLGPVPLDFETTEKALQLPQVQLLDEAHEGEHSLEVHLPFLQVVLGDFSLVPLVVGDTEPEEVAEVLRVLWGGPETLIVVSSDLSHFLPYDRAMALDESTARAIEECRPDRIHTNQACGKYPVGGLLLRVRAEGLEVERVDLRNSGDTAGSRDRVVGYGSFLFA